METQPKVGKIASRYGLILALISIAYFIILSIFGLMGNSALGWAGYIFTIVLIVMAHNAFKDQGDSYMSYGQGLSIGVLVSLISGVISSIFSFIYIKFIDDSMLQIIKDKAIEDMEEKGNSDEQIEQALKMMDFFMSPLGITVMGVIGAVFVGFILSLIISAITKNSNPELEI